MTEQLHFHFPALEKEIATHSSVLAWRIPGTGKPGGLPSLGSHRVRHDWSHLVAAAAYKLNKQSDNLQPCRIPFSILNKWVFPCTVLTVASQPTYRFLKRQVTWSSIPISLRIFQFIVIHTVKGFSIVNEAEVDIFLEFPCFLYVPVNVGNLISGSSAFFLTQLEYLEVLGSCTAEA